MESLETIFNEILKYLDVSYCLVVVFLSYALRDVLASMLEYLRFPEKHSRTFSVFFLATAVAFVWHFFVGSEMVKLFVSYSATTTLYELFLKHISKNILHE